MKEKMIGIIGGGSWATALVKILLENPGQRVNWWVRSEEVCDHIKRHGHNPRHLPDANLDASRLNVSTDISAIAADSTHLLLATPSAYLHQVLDLLPDNALNGKRIISAVKGTIPDCCLSVSAYLVKHYHLPKENICIVSGPSHAEEVSHEMPTFLTVASTNPDFAREMQQILRCHYVHTRVSADIDGIERCGLGKNIYAIAAGLCQGLGYGDNLNAVLTAAALREMQAALDRNIPFAGRDIRESCYMGDLVVTCWSRHSRNRALGEAVSRGERPADVFARTGSVAEGYFSVKNMHSIALEHGLTQHIPIAEAVYRILYEEADPKEEINNLIDNAF